MSSYTSRKLNAWNPLDWLLLLWWLLIVPERFVEYRAQVGENSVKNVGIWLASTLAWMPLFILVLGIGIGVVSVFDDWLGNPPPIFICSSVALVGWLMTGLFGITDNIVGFVVSVGLAGALTIGLGIGIETSLVFGFFFVAAFIREIVVKGRVVIDVIYIVALSLSVVLVGTVLGSIAGAIMSELSSNLVNAIVDAATGIAAEEMAGVVAGVIKTNIDNERTDFVGKHLFTALALSYAALIWIYWLGGWRVLGGVVG